MGLPFTQMVALKEYPADPMPLYAQGFSVVEYLLLLGRQIDSHEHRRLLLFAQSAMDSNNWQNALRTHYDIDSLGTLQLNWVQWVNTGFTIEKNLPLLAETKEQEPKNQQEHNLSVNQSIMLVSAKPTTIQEKYGKSVYDKSVENTNNINKIERKTIANTVLPIPAKIKNDPIITIPTSFEITQTNFVPAEHVPVNRSFDTDQNKSIRFDSATLPVRR
jgi:hypothetical protein